MERMGKVMGVVFGRISFYGRIYLFLSANGFDFRGVIYFYG